MKKIVSTNPDGSVAVTSLAPKAMAQKGWTEDELREFVKGQLVERGLTPIADVDETELPDDSAEEEYVREGYTVVKRPCGNKRAFRDEWIWDGLKLMTDPDKKKAKKAERVRAIRNELLKVSDTDMMLANEIHPAQVPAMKQYRQELRDIGAQADADPDNIVWPVKP